MNEQKNLLLAIVASLLILLVFQYLFPNKPDVKTLEISNSSKSKLLNLTPSKYIGLSKKL